MRYSFNPIANTYCLLSTKAHQNAIQKFGNKYWKIFFELKKNALNILGPLLTGMDLIKRAENCRNEYLARWHKRCGINLVIRDPEHDKFNSISFISIPREIISNQLIRT